MNSTTAQQSTPDKAHLCHGMDDDRAAGILKLIQPGSVLGSLPQRDLLSLLRQSTLRTLPRHRVLFRSGDHGRLVVLILQGYVKLSTTTTNGREVVLEIAEPGTLFGEIAVLSGLPRKADATCLTACRVLAIDGGAFRHAIIRTPEAMLAAIQLLIERLAATTTRRIDAVSLPAPVRLAKALLYLAEMHSRRKDDGVQIGFRLSQRELGAMTGLIRESINKHLKVWRAAGWVALSGREVTLCNLPALQEIAAAE